MSETDSRQERLQQIAKIAVALEAQTGCPAAMLIAQWALESKWGEKPVGRFNCFGIKKADRHDKSCTVTTREVVRGKSVVLELEFADYDSLEDSCKDYAWLITSAAPYHQAWTRYQRDNNLHALIAAIAGTYASDPSYASLVAAIAGQSNVSQVIADARCARSAEKGTQVCL